MLQESLVSSVAKLDIKDLLESDPSPPPSRPIQPPPFSNAVAVSSIHLRCNPTPSPSPTSTVSHCSASTATSTTNVQQYDQQPRQLQAQPAQLPSTVQTVFHQDQKLHHDLELLVAKKRSFPMDEKSDSPPKKNTHTKWSRAEDAKVIHLRGKGMKWEDIAKEIPGRSHIACRLHFQNYLERRCEWDEEKKDRLARVYDRLKSELWKPIASELGVPWRAAENMHWNLGEQEMARRANVQPFSITAVRAEPYESGSGRVAQRERMLGSQRVFEGWDFSTINSSFNSVNEYCQNPAFTLPAGPYGIPNAANVQIAPLKSEHSLGGFEDDDDFQDDEDDERSSNSNARTRWSGGETRLPGLAQLVGEVQAYAGRERGSVVLEGRRRGSGESNSSRSSG